MDRKNSTERAIAMYCGVSSKMRQEENRHRAVLKETSAGMAECRKQLETMLHAMNTTCAKVTVMDGASQRPVERFVRLNRNRGMRVIQASDLHRVLDLMSDSDAWIPCGGDNAPSGAIHESAFSSAFWEEFDTHLKSVIATTSSSITISKCRQRTVKRVPTASPGMLQAAQAYVNTDWTRKQSNLRKSQFLAPLEQQQRSVEPILDRHLSALPKHKRKVKLNNDGRIETRFLKRKTETRRPSLDYKSVSPLIRSGIDRFLVQHRVRSRQDVATLLSGDLRDLLLESLNSRLVAYKQQNASHTVKFSLDKTE